MTMAAIQLPPRFSRKSEEITIRRNKTSLEILVQMGFPKPRAEKALAATGDKGVQLASDWLLSHINDPTLDENVPRDYILYLCPVGQLQQEFLQFWKKSYEDCGWNRAHNYFPHVTLCSFFKAQDSQVSQLSHMLKNICESYASEIDLLELEYFSSNNFIGLFLSTEGINLLRKITNEYADEMKKQGITVDPHKKQLHASLAYQFPANDKEQLEDLAKSIRLNLPVRWDLRLYSREPRVANMQVRKVNYRHTPAANDELTLIIGDFIYTSEEEMKKSQDTWYRGVSWLTGCAGMFPGPYTERVAETETWTMHRSIPIIGTDIGIKLDEFGINGPIEFDNPLYHDERRNLVPPDSVLHFPASPSRVKSATPQPHPSVTGAQVSAAGIPSRSPSFERKDIISKTEPSGSCQSSPSSSNTSLSDSSTSLNSSKRPQTSSTSSSSVSSSSNSSAPANLPHQQNSATNTSTGSGTTTTSNSSNLPSTITNNNTTNTKVSAQSEPDHTRLNQFRPVNSPSSSPQHSAAAAGAASGASPVIVPSSSPASPAGSSGGEVTGVGTGSGMNHAKGTTPRGGALKGKQVANCPARSRGPRQLYVVRHGERIDFTFGKDWIQNSFDTSGNYIRYDLNMPKSLPKRKGGPDDFRLDSPLTVQGTFQARLLGEALKDVEVPLTHIYASPALRCVETATHILQGMGLTRKIHIEPGLFEWHGWYRTGAPTFMTIPELQECGFSIDTSHDVIWPYNKFDANEKTDQYYNRCHEVTKEILKRHEMEGGNVLILGHAASLDASTRQLVGHPLRTQDEFFHINHKIPYCAMAVAQEGIHVREAWYIIEPPVLPFAHTNNPKYNWTTLTSSMHT